MGWGWDDGEGVGRTWRGIREEAKARLNASMKSLIGRASEVVSVIVVSMIVE